MTTGIFQLAGLVLTAAVLGVIARLLKQPIILAYLATGIVVGYFGFFNLHDQEVFNLFSDLGIMFLLFLVGLEINYTSLRLVGKTALVLGIGQIAVTFSLVFGLARLLGFPALSAAYIGAGLSFASTIIVVKLLSEKKDLGSLYGKVAIGLLLVQDFVAVLVLVLLGGVGETSGVVWVAIVMALLKGILLFGLMLWLGRNVLPYVFDRVARAPELLFLVSLAWVFLVAAAVSTIGFSIEIAGLLAGLALANSAEHFQIAGKIRPLRDFFVLIFFVILGSSLAFSNFNGLVLAIVAFSLFVLVINPLIVVSIMGMLGHRKRTSFYTGITIGQVSEFSLVLAALGVRIGHIPGEIASLITALAIITITTSTYLVTHADKIFARLRKALQFFEKKGAKREGEIETRFEKPIILIGANRTGESILRHLPAEDFLVVEFDPDVVEKLKQQGIAHIFGDMVDPEIFEKANFEAARLVISTSPDLQDNLNLLEAINILQAHPKVIVRAENERDADILYEAGADYVLLPHVTSGQYLGKTLAIDPEMNILEGLRESDMAMFSRGQRGV